MDDAKVKAGFQIFRAADAPSLMEAGCLAIEPFTEIQQAGVEKMIAEGYSEGDDVKVLCNFPGFSLTLVWFKAGFPLPLHSHDVDCLYYIIGGSLNLGTEELGARDSFFIPAGVPYTYKPGANGVELLEFRHANNFNFVNHAKGEGYWKRALDTVVANRDAWKVAERPTVSA